VPWLMEERWVCEDVDMGDSVIVRGVWRGADADEGEAEAMPWFGPW
jgi:hypothetical protein